MTQYWDEKFYIFQHTLNEVHKQRDSSYISSNVGKTLSQPLEAPIYQTDRSGSVGLDVNKASYQHSEHASTSDHLEDTCSKDSCNTKFAQDKSSDGNKQLKILTFNIWNTNVVQGGYKQYLARIKQIAKVSEKKLGFCGAITDSFKMNESKETTVKGNYICRFLKTARQM